ncbi:MAG TPA: ROK family transcriptional regulator [Propionibacteriaceae bacterium]|nr:ROK family transcriptional regulator [Propionibacteriaceae bacterium]
MQMPARRRLRPEDARRSNRALVLQAINNDPRLSRADIARTTGLTKVTVSDLVAELIAADLVLETGPSGASRPGKPSTILGLNASANDILTMDLSAADQFRGAVISLKGELLATHVRPLGGAVGRDAITIARELAADLAEAATHPILGLGVGTPGTVNADGHVLSAPGLRWRNVHLRDELTPHFPFPVHVENDANLGVLAERQFAGGSDNLLRVRLSRGVGAGLLVGGALVQGVASDAGEIGHVVIDETGDPCDCGKIGCLESWISVPALTRRIASAPDRRDAILAEAGHRLGVALAPVVSMLGLQHVVIGGPHELIAGPLVEATRSCVTERTRSEFRPDLHIVATSLGADGVLLGAAALILLRELGIA